MQGKKLFVGNLRHNATNEDLRQLFSSLGEVVNVNILEGRGFGFVEMSTQEEAEKAIAALNGTVMEGRTLTVNQAKPKGDRSGGGRSRERW